MISFIRDYVKQQVLAVNPELKEWTDAFNTENVPSNIYDKAFHFIYEVPTYTKDQAYYEQNINGTLTLFFKGDRYPQDAFDSGMDNADDIALNVSRISNIQAYQNANDLDNPLAGVDILSIIPSNPVSNDNRIIITISLEFLIFKPNC